MNILLAVTLTVVAFIGMLVVTGMVGGWLIERNHPPVGEFASIEGARVHYVHSKPDSPELPPVVFIHGASGNLLDQMLPTRRHLEGRAELLFMDRPGYGWSQRGTGNDDPYGQAATIAALMDERGIADAIVVGHSFGGAVAASLALEHPDKVRGLVFLSPATHPWPGGETSWYYTLSARPFIGRLFVNTLALPGGLLQIEAASSGVFSPNRKPRTYVDDAAIKLVLRPNAFRWNAVDVAGLYRHVVKAAPRYKDIAVPTIVVSGNRDTVVYEEIHSLGLVRDIPNAELVWIDNLGHKPDWIAPDLVAAAVETVAGQQVDLSEIAVAVRARIAGDAFGPIEPRADDPELPLLQ